MTAERRVRAVAEGRVQGVGYREFARRAAARFGLRGWARNRRDGAVEIEIAGPAASVEAMLAELRRGPPAAAVTALRVGPAESVDPGPGFTIRPTA